MGIFCSLLLTVWYHRFVLALLTNICSPDNGKRYDNCAFVGRSSWCYSHCYVLFLSKICCFAVSVSGVVQRKGKKTKSFLQLTQFKEKCLFSLLKLKLLFPTFFYFLLKVFLCASFVLRGFSDANFVYNGIKAWFRLVSDDPPSTRSRVPLSLW